MNGKFSMTVVSGLAIGLAGATQARAAEVDWDLSESVIAGTGCSADTHFLEGDGSLLRAVGSAISLSLRQNGSRNALRSACTIRATAVVPRGFYISSIESAMVVSSDRSGDALGKVAFLPKMSTVEMDVFEMSVPFGRQIMGLESFASTEESRRSLCNGEENRVIVGGNLVLSGRLGDYGKLRMSIGDGNDIDLLFVNLSPCFGF